MSKAATMTSVSRKKSKNADVATEPIVACIDMGTNSFHMIVCEAAQERDHFEVLTTMREPVPFFRRALTAHSIDAGAMTSAMRILKDMQTKAAQKGATSVLAVATSAVRESDNGDAVLERIRTELNLDARMISGKEEARLIYLGVLWSMRELKGRFAIVDIGGGSTEVIVGDRHRTYFSESYKLGAARLTQRFFRKEKPSTQEIRELHDEVRGMLRPASARLVEAGGFNQLIATSGTAQALAKLDRARRASSSKEDLNGYSLTLSDLESLVDFLEEQSLSGMKIKEISTDRSRTILAGAVVLLEAMRSLNVSQVTICTAALREGVIVDMLLQQGWLNAGLTEHIAPRANSVHALLVKYQSSIEHAEQVADLASQIFEQTKNLKLHSYNDAALHLLWSAAMLHDVGMFVGRNGHHKHSFYLIKHGGLLGHSEEEVSIIANIARYHRGSEPKVSHEPFMRLPEDEKKLVCDMSSILRLAEALDRSHRQVVQRIDLDVAPGGKNKDERKNMTLIVYVRPGENWEPETWALKEKKAVFEKQFGGRLTVEVRVESRYGRR